MTDSQPSPIPASSTLPRGRVIGIVIRVYRDRGYGFVRDEDGNEYMLHRHGCVPTPFFGDLVEGLAVSFRKTVTTKGQRAYDARGLQTAEEWEVAERLREKEETRGNQ